MQELRIGIPLRHKPSITTRHCLHFTPGHVIVNMDLRMQDVTDISWVIVRLPYGRKVSQYEKDYRARNKVNI